MKINLDEIFDPTHCCQCGTFLEPSTRDFTHLCWACWMNRPETKSILRHAKAVGWDLPFALDVLKRYQYSRMN